MLYVTSFLHYRVLNKYFKTLAVIINIYSNWLQENGELTFDISLETCYAESKRISRYTFFKLSKYLATRNYDMIRCSPNRVTGDLLDT